MKSVSVWPKVYEEMLQQHGEAFERLYPQGYPSPEDIYNFEMAVRKAVPGNQITDFSKQFITVSDKIDIWGHAFNILKYSSEHRPTARQGVLPTVSQVYLELVLYYLVLHDGLCKDVTGYLATIRDDPRVSSVARLFQVQDRLGSSGKDVPMIRNIRNALAHTRLKLQETNVIYCSTTNTNDVTTRPIEDISLVGELLWRYTIVVIDAKLVQERQ